MNSTDRKALVHVLLGPDGPELTCEQCFDLLDEYVDRQIDRMDADRGIPGMRAHLQGCPACDEDYRSLLAFAIQARGN